MSFESPNNPIPPTEDVPKQPLMTEIPEHLFSEDPYKVLGIPKTATLEEIKRAKKNLQKKFHPDINEDPRSAKVSQNINTAFNTLNEVITVSAEIELGGFVPRDYLSNIIIYGKSKNVEVKFNLMKKFLLSSVYSVKFKGKHGDVKLVKDYIKNRSKL